MLKKNEGNINKILLKYDSLYEINDNVLITPSLAIMINNYLDSLSMNQHIDYETKKIMYLNKRNENYIKKQYNELIVNLYQNGQIIINNETCDLKNFFILYNEEDKNYFLTYSKSTYTDFLRKSSETLPYNKAVKFIDSTLFILLINDPSINIINNTIIIDNNDILLNIIDNWDGKLHNKIWFTDSIMNKKILKED